MTRLRCGPIALASAWFALGAGAPSPFTLEQVLSAPFPSELTASPQGGKVAWIMNARGVRNVWIAEAPVYKGRMLTSYTEDDGQEIGKLAWSPDGKNLVYVRGEASNAHGEHPNPGHVAAGVDQNVCAISSAGGVARVLGAGRSPEVAPDGTVAFVSKGQIWTAPIDGHEKARQWLHARGDAESLRWSPDGSALAFVSARGDHAFIALYKNGSPEVRFLDTSVDVDSEPAWSPDGREIAFIRVPASQYAFAFGPVRTAEPWSIRVADLASGKGRQIWKSQTGRGSAFWPMVARNQLLWADGGRIVFPWERDGRLHLYSTSVRDGGAALLTPGDFEVEHVTLTADLKQALFSSNQNDIDRRHIWRVPVEGGAPIEVTPGSGLEWDPAAMGEGGIAFLRSAARQPARAAMRTASGDVRDLAPQATPPDFPAADLGEPRQVIFSSADGLQIHGQLFLPRGYSPSQRYPAVIFFHGGSRRQMLLGWHYMFYYNQAYGFNQYLSSKGYMVLAVNYRSGIGYGLDFREAKDYGATGASEYNDVVGAGLYLRGRTDVRGDRIGLWGGSYGGYLTALGLARASDLFAVGVDLHGVHEWNLEIKNFVPAYDPEKHADVARVAFQSSPMAYISTWRSPVLLIHGDDDRNVPFTESVMLAEALRKQGVPFEQLIFPDEIHDFLMHRHWLAAYHAADEFLARYLLAP